MSKRARGSSGRTSTRSSPSGGFAIATAPSRRNAIAARTVALSPKQGTLRRRLRRVIELGNGDGACDHDRMASDRGEPVRARIEVWQGDITTLDVDAIVNAANSSLL